MAEGNDKLQSQHFRICHGLIFHVDSAAFLGFSSQTLLPILDVAPFSGSKLELLSILFSRKAVAIPFGQA